MEDLDDPSPIPITSMDEPEDVDEPDEEDDG